MSTQYLKIGMELENYDFARRPIKSNDRVSGLTPYLGASGIVDFVEGFTHEGTYLCVSEDGENLRSRKTPIAWVQNGRFWANNHVHILGSVSENRLHFYAAALNNSDIGSFVTGSAQPKLSQSSLSEITLPFFDAQQQENIGSFLSGLDNKIAANSAIIDTAKDLACTIAQKSRTMTPLGELASIVKNSVSPVHFSGKYINHFSLPAFDVGHSELELADNIKSAKNHITKPVVLVSKLNPRIPRIWAINSANDDNILASPEFIALKSKAGTAAELWASLISPSFTRGLLERVTGTTGSHQRVRPERALEIEICDTRTLTSEQRESLGSLSLMRDALIEESRTLAATRDELLPLLMSGKITVADAEKRITE
ncbi:MAG: restriction endonuclease subunit S [Corynebacterium nuruki]|nr:restriction endonuclease subunit S [Corynebacterium nuruki]